MILQGSKIKRLPRRSGKPLMHKADLQHSDKRLKQKLEKIFQLRRTRSAVNWDRALYLSLLKSFGNPHKDLPPVIHVAGTNGKGSVIAMLRSILEASGKTVHSYTSPHLIHVNERIYLAGKPIEDDYLESLIDEALSYIDDAPLSFFEVTTALAFKAFSDHPADVLLLEVGMGGELDCTNVVEKPVATIINRVSMDHTAFLGDDVRDIARAKAGIMKKDAPCIIGYQGEGQIAGSINDVMRSHASDVGAKATFYDDDWSIEKDGQEIVFSHGDKKSRYPLPVLTGDHQVLNAGLAVMTLKMLGDDFSVSDKDIAKGLKTVYWPGRMQRLDPWWSEDIKNTEIWLDSGHNDSAGEAVAQQMKRWKEKDDKPIHLVVAMLGTKNAGAFLKPVLEHIEALHVVPVSSDPTSQSKEMIAESICSYGFDHQKTHEHKNVFQAISHMTSKTAEIRILIVGSVYLSGEVLSFIQTPE